MEGENTRLSEAQRRALQALVDTGGVIASPENGPSGDLWEIWSLDGESLGSVRRATVTALDTAGYIEPNGRDWDYAITDAGRAALELHGKAADNGIS